MWTYSTLCTWWLVSWLTKGQYYDKSRYLTGYTYICNITKHKPALKNNVQVCQRWVFAFHHQVSDDNLTSNFRLENHGIKKSSISWLFVSLSFTSFTSSRIDRVASIIVVIVVQQSHQTHTRRKSIIKNKWWTVTVLTGKSKCLSVDKDGTLLSMLLSHDYSPNRSVESSSTYFLIDILFSSS